MPAAFTYLKASCPICSGARRDCRQSTTTEAIHCRADVSPPSGYEPTTIDAQGFTIYVLGAKASDPSYWAERERQSQQRKADAQSALKKLLSVPLRDRMFRMVARHSGLASRHRSAIQKRCDDAQIPHSAIDYWTSKNLLWTWQPGESFSGVTSALPGVDRWGKLRYFPGWAIAIPDAHGRILGAQIKPENGSGYRWVSSWDERTKSGAKPNLPNGELPVGVYWPSELKYTDRIYFAEGYMKPAIVAERLGAVVMGFPQGAFGSKGAKEGTIQSIHAVAEIFETWKDTKQSNISEAGLVQSLNPKQLLKLQPPSITTSTYSKSTATEMDGQEKGATPLTSLPPGTESSLDILNGALSSQSLECGSNTSQYPQKSPTKSANKLKLTFLPDGGAVKNPQVMRSYKAAFEHLAKLGQVQVLWWGQTEKGGTDPDEIPTATLQSAELITADSFLSRVTESGQDDWRQRWETQAKASWQRTRRFTAPEIVDTQFAEVNIGDVMSADIHALKSGMGTGKTHAIAQLMQQTELGVVAIGSRNSLLLQSCERWGGFYHLHNDAGFGLTADPYSRIACCVDSLHHFGDNDFSGKIIILDEVLSVVKHALLSSTLKDKRTKALAKFEKAIKTAAAVIAWDGNNADIAINYLSAIRGDHCRVRKVLNRWQAAALKVDIVRVLGQSGGVWLTNNKPVLTKIGEALRANRQLATGKGLVVIADSQRLCQALDEVYAGQGFNVLRIDSHTATEDTIKQFLKDPDEFIADVRPDLVVMSPTAESGIDISIGDYFSQGFALFFGEIDTATQMQFLRRVRKCLSWTAWCVEYKSSDDADGSRSPLSTKVGAQLLDYVQADAVNALKGADSNLADQFLAKVKADATDIHYQTTLQFMAARNYELQHTRECLQQSLEEAGHTVNLIDIQFEDGSSADTEAISEAKETIIQRESEAVFNAPDISSKEAARIKGSFSSSPEERYAADKAILKSRLPGIEDSSIWSVGFVREVLFDNASVIRRLERYWMVNHLDAARQRSRDVYLQALEYGGFLPDIRTDLRLLQALNHLGLHQLGATLEVFDNESPQIKSIWERCKRSRRLQTALRRSPGRLKPIDWVSRLCRIIGISSQGHPKSRKERGQGRGDRLYSYHRPEDDPIAVEVLKCLSKRFEKYLNPETAETPTQQGDTPDHLDPLTNTLTAEGDPPQSKAGSEVYGFSQNDVADVREMRRAAGGDAAVLSVLRASIPPRLWEAAG
ncbi:MAG: plasmid replication protein, CyRepA1 family [Cyanobacteria bacterium J06638_20]